MLFGLVSAFPKNLHTLDIGSMCVSGDDLTVFCKALTSLANLVTLRLKVCCLIKQDLVTKR